MKIIALLSTLLTGCIALPSLDIDCQTNANNIICSWVDRDSGVDSGVMGAGPSDSGIDSSVVDAGAVDSGRDSGQLVVDSGHDSGSHDAGQTVDGGVVVSTNRPAYSTGTGFYVLDGKLYDGNGRLFRMSGVNRVHQDSQSLYLARMPSNTTRVTNYFSDDIDRTIRDVTGTYNGGTTANGKDMQIISWFGATCSSDTTRFRADVNRMVRDAAKLNTIERYSAININEALSGTAQWRSEYIRAIGLIRGAGYRGLLSITAPGCGQDAAAVLQAGREVFESDPMKNVIFDIHLYGAWYDSARGVAKQWSEQLDLEPTFNALKATGLAVMCGEIGSGPLLENGPSPTTITAERFSEVCVSRGFGVLGWAADDHTQANQTSNGKDFSMILRNDVYVDDSSLTAWGREWFRLSRLYGGDVAASVF
jgi:Cellulase (glycosyl hydrolase family 5)